MKIPLLLVFLFSFVACGKNTKEQISIDSVTDTTNVNENVKIERTSVDVKILGDRTH